MNTLFDNIHPASINLCRYKYLPPVHPASIYTTPQYVVIYIINKIMYNKIKIDNRNY
jgi:hypothetical protein